MLTNKTKRMNGRKITAIVMIAVMLLSLTGCGFIHTLTKQLLGSNPPQKMTEEQPAATDFGADEAGENKAEPVIWEDPDAESNEKNMAPERIDPDRAQTVLKEIDDDMSGYLWVILMSYVYDRGLTKVGDTIDLPLSDAQRLRAAALASEPDGAFDGIFVEKGGKMVLDPTAEAGPNGEGYHGYSVSKTSVEDACRDLFGVSADWNAFQTAIQCPLYDAVRYTGPEGDCALLLDSETESERDQESHTYRVEENGNGYTGKVEMFWGYWGELANAPGFSNYEVTYELVPSEDSGYGLVIARAHVTMIADYVETFGGDQGSEEENYTARPTAFYGIWCSASKKQEDAQKAANALSEKGFDGRVFISSEWSNLNKETWYVVSAGTYATEEAAKAMLNTVKSSGYPDAYVKFSGNPVSGTN